MRGIRSEACGRVIRLHGRMDPAARRLAERLARTFRLDSKAPAIPLSEFAVQEGRFAMLTRTSPDRFERLMEEAQRDIDERWSLFAQLAGIDRTAPDLPRSDLDEDRAERSDQEEEGEP